MSTNLPFLSNHERPAIESCKNHCSRNELYLVQTWKIRNEISGARKHKTKLSLWQNTDILHLSKAGRAACVLFSSHQFSQSLRRYVCNVVMPVHRAPPEVNTGTKAVHSVALWTRTFSQVWTCVLYVHGSSPLRSTLNTNVITGLDMCKVCTEAVHSVALWTRTLSQVWTCVKYVPKQSTP